MLERRVIILLKYSLNPLNICERNIYPSESDLQSLCLDCGNKVHHEEQFQDLPDNTTNETSKAVLELANSLQLYLPGPGHRPVQARSTICCCSVQIEKLQLKLYLWHVMFMTIPIILKVSLNFSRVFPSLNNSNNNNVFDLILWRPSIKIY